MSVIFTSSYPEFYVSGAHFPACNLATLAPVGAFSPSKKAALFVVAKELAKAFAGKIRSSHEAPVKQIGQRPASVSALSGLCYGIAP